jgi:hypothetical protein
LSLSKSVSSFFPLVALFLAFLFRSAYSFLVLANKRILKWFPYSLFSRWRFAFVPDTVEKDGNLSKIAATEGLSRLTGDLDLG